MISVLDEKNAQIHQLEGGKLVTVQKVLTERIQIKTSKRLRELFQYSKNLYNYANKIVYQGFYSFVLTKGRYTQKAGKRIRYNPLEWELRDDPTYRALPAQTAQQLLLLIDRNWTAFFEALDDWKESPQKYRNRPNPPGQKNNEEEWLLVFTNQQIRVRGDYMLFPKRTQLAPVKINPKRIGKLQQVRVLPRGSFSIVEIVYTTKLSFPAKKGYERGARVIGIDLGVRNVVCLVSNCGLRPIIVKGGKVKWINQFYNKQRTKLKKIYAMQGIKGETKRLENLNRVRNNKIEDLFHKLSRAIISYCVNNKIQTIIIGYNALWKQKVQMGRRNNQSFVNIPLQRLIQKIQYKAELSNIEVVLVEESYTSKCSFFDNEPLEYHEKYLGIRGVYISKKNGGKGGVHTGLFQTAKGVIINSDVNGAYNILRKVFPEAFSMGNIKGLGLIPLSVTFTDLEQLANLKSTQNVCPKASNTDGLEVRGFVD